MRFLCSLKILLTLQIKFIKKCFKFKNKLKRKYNLVYFLVNKLFNEFDNMMSIPEESIHSLL